MKSEDLIAEAKKLAPKVEASVEVSTGNTVKGSISMDHSDNAKKLAQEAQEAAKQAAKNAGKEACFVLVKDCVDSLMEVVETQKIDPADLVDSKARSLSIPEAVSQQIASLSQQIAHVINKVATQIEESNYENWEEAVEGLADMSYKRRQELERLIDGEKQINVSVQSLGMAVDVFAHVNRQIIAELEAAEEAGDKAKARKLIIYNAVLIYELCKAVIKYLDQFKLFGRDQIQEVDRAIRERAQEATRRAAELERLAKDPAIHPATRAIYENQIRNTRDILERMLASWQDYKNQIDTTCTQAIGACGDLRRRLEAQKASAALQISCLDVASVIGMMRTTFQDFEKITATVEGLELAVLTPERVTSLFLQEA